MFALPPDCADVDPFSMAQPAPLVFLPPDLTGEQARHLLAHELGQLVLRHSRPGSREAHVEAGKFAAAFLMPRTAVIAAMLCSADPHRLASARQHVGSHHQKPSSAACATWSHPAPRVPQVLDRLRALNTAPVGDQRPAPAGVARARVVNRAARL